MKKLLLSTLLVCFMMVMAQTTFAENFSLFQTELANKNFKSPPRIKLSICIKAVFFEVCTDVYVECHALPYHAGVSCSISTTRLSNGEMNADNSMVTIKLPEDWAGVEYIEFPDLKEEGNKIKPGIYYIHDGILELPISK